MKIDFKTLGGEKVNYSDLFVDAHGNVYGLSTEGYLYAKSGIIAKEREERLGKTPNKTTVPNIKSKGFKW